MVSYCIIVNYKDLSHMVLQSPPFQVETEVAFSTKSIIASLQKRWRKQTEIKDSKVLQRFEPYGATVTTVSSGN